jgi:hypothetical protein
MALTALNSHKKQLEKMAETWEQLAEARRRQLEKKGESEEGDAGPQQSSLQSPSA